MKPIKTFRGSVRTIRAFSLPGAEGSLRRLETVAWGEIDGRPVTFHSSRNTRSIRDGDDMLVSGWAERGFFQAIAYTNLTTGYSYRPPYRAGVGALVASVVVAPAALIYLPAVEAAVTMAILAALAAMLWAMTRTGMLAARANRDALARLRAAAASRPEGLA